MLARPRLRDDPPLPHPFREQGLTERVVDLVRAGVREVLAFQQNAGAAKRPAQVSGLVERRRTSDVVAKEHGELVPKGFVVSRREIGGLEIGHGCDQRLGHESPAVFAVVAAAVGVALPE